MGRVSSTVPGDHSFFRISRHISPLLKWTLGWKTLVLKEMVGDTMGYLSPTMISAAGTEGGADSKRIEREPCLIVRRRLSYGSPLTP
jgi:hypothetical protein